MAADVRKAVGALFDGMSVSAGGLSASFPYLPWGLHFDAAGPVCSVRTSSTASPRDVGPNPDYLSSVLVDIHLLWENSDSLTDADAFREAVENAAKAIIAANAEPTAESLFLAWIGMEDLTGFIDGSRTLRFYLVIRARATLLEAMP